MESIVNVINHENLNTNKDKNTNLNYNIGNNNPIPVSIPDIQQQNNNNIKELTCKEKYPCCFCDVKIICCYNYCDDSEENKQRKENAPTYKLFCVIIFLYFLFLLLVNLYYLPSLF